MISKTSQRVKEIMPLVWELYATDHGSVGGCLHIVLDDNNICDGSIEFCIDYAKREKCDQCLLIAEMLMKMSEDEREVVTNHVYCAHDVTYRCRCKVWEAVESGEA